MAKKKNDDLLEIISENISIEPLENVMGDRYATYAKYVIQDRAIPDVRDGLKPVQRRIIYSMYKHGNLFNKPTKKCAHTVGAVMGTFHPHGDTSIYEALARMSQEWKVRYPLIDFQGNNGSIDGDSPAAYRYTEARLSELSNELIKDIDKNTVDMQLNFDDTEFEPTVLPSRFPNLLVNGTEGIAVAMATEIPTHNLKEVIDATIYRINHKTATIEDLLQFVKGPDFPGGGIIYESEGLKNIYLTGKGRIEIGSRAQFIKNKDIQQIIITEIPYKVAKIALVYEIDKIIHSKTVSGLIEVRDESDWKGIRIVIDVKKDANAELLYKYLTKKTLLSTSYSANMVAIVNGRPKTLNLLDFIDAYISHQVDVVTRQSTFDLDKFNKRLHIVEGLIKASLNINVVVDIIRKSEDKADSKNNLINHFGFSLEQAEAIVTMPLYKLSHTDEIVLEKEKNELQKNIEQLKGILEDPNKLNRFIIKGLKTISDKYGDERRTTFEIKNDNQEIDKRQLIDKEKVIVAATKDGYIKRSSLKSFKSSGTFSLPGLKVGDALVSFGEALTTDYLLAFTNLGNYICVPVHKIVETKWKDEGVHLNTMTSLGSGEKIIKSFVFTDLRNDLFLGAVTQFGQIKRMPIDSLELSNRIKPNRYMKLLNGDNVVGVQLLKGNNDLLVFTNNGYVSRFNENELTIIGPKAAGVKSIANLGKNRIVSLLVFDKDERGKIILFTNKGHQKIIDINKISCTSRLGKTTLVLPCFKGDVHTVVACLKINNKDDSNNYYLYLNDQTIFTYNLDDTHVSDIARNAKKNISIHSKQYIENVYDTDLTIVDKRIVSQPIITKEVKDMVKNLDMENDQDSTIIDTNETNDKETSSYEQISIFDDVD